MILFDSLINTFFFLGKSPSAPGTVGSIGALIIWYFIPFPPNAVIFFLLCLFVLSYCTISSTLTRTGDKDPQYIVIDEVIGMWISLLPLSYTQSLDDPLHVSLMVLAFLLFRIFDIIKPSIIYRSQFVPGPLGVLLDDILAGAFSGLIIAGILSRC